MVKKILCCLLTLILVGCANIPTSGPVEKITNNAEPKNVSRVDIAPAPPAPGADPQMLVEGFLQAMAGYQTDYVLAKKYLTPEAASHWDPKSQVLIYQGGINYTQDNSVKLAGKLVGKLDLYGHFQSQDNNLSLDLKIVKINSQWRISQPPKGILISSYLFNSYYKSIPVYFINPNFTNVVPDLIYLPEAKVKPAEIIKSLLAGPSKELALSATSAIPAGTKLTREELKISDNGVIEIPLTSQIKSLREDKRRLLGAQLSWTMYSFAKITSLKITVEGKSFSIPGEAKTGILELSGQHRFQVLSGTHTEDIFAIKNNKLGRIISNKFIPVEGDLGKGIIKPYQIGISIDGIELAAVESSGSTLVTGMTDGPAQVVDTSGFSDLSQPQIKMREIWTTAVNSQGVPGILTIRNLKEKIFISLPTPLRDVKILKFAVAPGGARIALLAENKGISQLVIAMISRDQKKISSWRVLTAYYSNSPLGGYLDFGWADDIKLVTIANSPDVGVYSVSEDGAKVEWLGPGGRTDLLKLSASPKLSGVSMIVTRSDGKVIHYEDQSRWRNIPGKYTNVFLAGG